MRLLTASIVSLVSTAMRLAAIELLTALTALLANIYRLLAATQRQIVLIVLRESTRCLERILLQAA